MAASYMVLKVSNYQQLSLKKVVELIALGLKVSLLKKLVILTGTRSYCIFYIVKSDITPVTDGIDMNPLVLVLSYNHVQLTERCLLSIQKYFKNGQIVLIHNGSEVINVDILRNKFPDIIHLQLSSNRGYAGGLNAGFKYFLEETKIERCLVLTNDTQLISYQAEIELCPAHLIAPLIYFKSLLKVDSWGGYYHLVSGRLKHYKDRVANISISEMDSFYVPGTAFLVHRNILSAGLFLQESLFTFWEDVYWSAMVKKQGFSLARTNLITISHAGGKTTRKDTMYTSYYFQRNRLIVCVKLQTKFYKKIVTFLWISFEIKMQVLKQVKLGKWLRATLLIKAMRDALVIIFKNASQSSDGDRI